jgi:hypothetical protein
VNGPILVLTGAGGFSNSGKVADFPKTSLTAVGGESLSPCKAFFGSVALGLLPDFFPDFRICKPIRHV